MNCAHHSLHNISHIQPKTVEIVEDIKLILQTSLADHPNFDMVADAFNMSGRTLRRQLSVAGTSFQKILDHQRTVFAKHALEHTHQSAEEIADALGFTDVANFRHAFKRWVGVSPSAYRKQFQKQAYYG